MAHESGYLIFEPRYEKIRFFSHAETKAQLMMFSAKAQTVSICLSNSNVIKLPEKTLET